MSDSDAGQGKKKKSSIADALKNMPLFGGKGKKDKEKNSPAKDSAVLIDSDQSPAAAAKALVVNKDLSSNNNNNKMPSTPAAEANGAAKVPSSTNQAAEAGVQPARPKLVFHCQQAQGSPTGVISNFTNVKELYQKIAECYDFEPSQILFCTLNTHKVEMNALLGGQIGLDDFIFAHIRGRPKEVEIDKFDDALGLTITDNGAGFSFIKRIKEGSIIDKIEGIYVGDHIEKIDDISMVGNRHYEVAKILKEIPKGTTFKLRLVEPLKSGFYNVAASSSSQKKSGGIGTGRETLRLRSKGSATVQAVDDNMDIAVEKINSNLESFLGINDTELAQTIWEMGCQQKNPLEFEQALSQSDLRDFGFTQEFVFELWGVISDAKQGRLKKNNVEEFSEQF